VLRSPAPSGDASFSTYRALSFNGAGLVQTGVCFKRGGGVDGLDKAGVLFRKVCFS
jgi:hypothetical protein